MKTPEVLYKNEIAIKNDLSVLNSNETVLNRIIEEYLKLELGEIESLSELESLLNNPRAFCEKAISMSVKEPFEFAGMKVSKKKLIEMITPEGISSFVSFVEGQKKNKYFGAKEWFPCVIQGDSDYGSIKFPFVNSEWMIFDNGVVSNKPEMKESIINKYSCQLDTVGKNNTYEFINGIVDDLNELNSLLKANGFSPINITGLIYANKENKLVADKRALIHLIKKTNN